LKNGVCTEVTIRSAVVEKDIYSTAERAIWWSVEVMLM
jgi:hypothetical protein